MSSADSDILAAGTIYSNDIYGVYIKPGASDSDLLKASQNMMVLAGIISMVIALFSAVGLMKILTLSFAVRSAGTLFPYLLGQCWSTASSAGTIASILAGSSITLYLECFSINSLMGVPFSQPIIPGLAVSLIVFLVFSLLFPSRDNKPQQ
jgi:SSS family solute:Na+ symporter